MDFALTEEQKMIADTARDFFTENATSERTRAAMAAGGLDAATWRAYCEELGFGGLGMPEAFGGAGLGMVEFATVAEAAGAQVAAIPLLGQAMAIAAILAGGDTAQKERWLGPIAGGEKVAVVAEAGSADFAGDRLTAQLEHVPHGAVADLFLVLGAENAWIVETAAAGVTITAHTSMDQTRPLAGVRIEALTAVPLADAAAAAAAARRIGWICLAAEGLGAAQACLDRTVAYARERV